MNEQPEIFEGEDLKEIEKGRNSDWSKEFFIRKKAEALESLNEQYAETTNAVEVNETVLEELNKQTEETIQTMVETEAQKEFMRYAFLKEPKTPIGKLVAGAWRKFKEWWDMHKRKGVEEKTRENRNLFLHLVESLAVAIDTKDNYTNGHSQRVADYSREIAKRARFSEKDQEEIYIMGLLHDIGKIGIPDAVINKPDKLSDEEYEIASEGFDSWLDDQEYDEIITEEGE